MISIGFRVDWRHLGRFEARMFTLQPSGKAARILGIESDGFGREIRALGQRLLPDGNLIPHGSSLLSAQLPYRHSFWRDRLANSADNIPPERENCADKGANLYRNPFHPLETRLYML